MALLSEIPRQVVCFGAIGAAVGTCLLVADFPTRTTAEMIQAAGNLSLIAGSLVGWSIGWISQSRGLIRDIDYNAAEEIFQELGKLQIEIVRRWKVVFVVSLLSVILSVFMKMPDLECVWYALLLVFSSGFLMVGVVFILRLFQQMIALSHLKSDLEAHEREQLRKQRLIPGSQKGPSASEVNSAVLP